MRLRFCAVILFATALFRAAAGEPGVAEFPFEFHDGLIWLRVSTRESGKPLNFLLDSGAGASVINEPTAKKLGLKQGRLVKVQGVGTAAYGHWPVSLSAVPGTVPLPKNFLSVDLGELSEACECRVDGLLGADFFADHCVQIDFAARKIRLLPPMSLSRNSDALPLRMEHGAMLVEVRVDDGASRWVRLDTGCAAAFHWVTSRADLQMYPRQWAVALTRISVASTRTTVQLGQTRFDAVPTELHEKEIFAGESGLLGNGLLSRFGVVTINARAAKVILDKAPAPAGR